MNLPAGPDPISAGKLDELILSLKENLGLTFVVVTHELNSIFTIADNAVFLAVRILPFWTGGNPRSLMQSSGAPGSALFS